MSRTRCAEQRHHHENKHCEGSVIRMTSTHTAQALFASSLQPSDRPTAEQVAAAVHDSFRRHGGYPGCPSACATEYGDHPDAAAERMRWAIAVTERASTSVLVAA
jgi:hypothetical protein